MSDDFIVLPISEVMLAMDEAEARMLFYRERNSKLALFQHTSALVEWNANFVGRLGEVAVELWAFERRLQPTSMDKRGERYKPGVDFVFQHGSLCVEVKSNKKRAVEFFKGFMMPAASMEMIAEKAQVIIHTQVDVGTCHRNRDQIIARYPNGIRVDFLGFCYPKWIKEHLKTRHEEGKPAYYQYDTKKLFPMERLVEKANERDLQEKIERASQNPHKDPDPHARARFRAEQQKKRIKGQATANRKYRKAKRKLGL